MKEAYKHDYSGNCAPGSTENHIGQICFSVGIFQWIPTSDEKKLKKSAVKVRVYGYVHQPEAVYSKAKEIIKQLDDGTYTGKKNVTVKGT
jgi:hypothetical protein